MTKTLEVCPAISVRRISTWVYADDDDGWTEVARGRRSGRVRHQVEHRSVLDACTAKLKKFSGVRIPRFSIN